MKIGMLFPGYGSQFVGMGKELYDNSRIFQEYFEEASNCSQINFVKLCFASSDAELSKIQHAWPALFLVGVATAAVIKEACDAAGVSMSYMAGHGIGEYSALCAARVLSFPDGLYILSKLSLFYDAMRESLDAKSVIVNGLSSKKLKEICEEQSSAGGPCAHIAVYENKNDHIVTGHAEVVDAVAEGASDAGAQKVKEIEAAEGFHTPLLQDLVEQLKIYLTKVDFKDPQLPLIMSINGKEVCRAKKAQDAIMRQIVEPVNWTVVLKQCADADVLVVPAPSKALVAEISALYPDKKVIGFDTMADVEAFKALLAEYVATQAAAVAAAAEQATETLGELVEQPQL